MTATSKGPGRIRIRALGGLRVDREGEPLAALPGQPVRCALLLYLAWERGATRDEITAVLWPERDSERARASLSQTLYELRRALGDGWVEARADRLEATPALTLDALDFIGAVEEGRHAEALALYAGPFLQGTHLGVGRAFEEWADRRRGRIERTFREAARAVADEREAAGELDEALRVAEWWTELDPLDDEAQHRVIRSLAALGRRAEALARYERYRDLLARELQVEPLDETKELVGELRDGGARGAGRVGEDGRAGGDGQAGDTEGPQDSRTPAAPPLPAVARPKRPGSRTVRQAGGAILLLGALGLGGAFLLRGATQGAPEGSGPPPGEGGSGLAEAGMLAGGDAYDLLLRGREYLNRPGEADVRKYPPAMVHFREALALDPGYAPAYVGLSRAFQAHVGLPLDVRRDSTLAYARLAVEADPHLAEAAAAMGWALLSARGPETAETWFRRTLEMEADQPDALEGLARLAWLDGRVDAAVGWQRRAVAVEPFSPARLSVLGSFLLDLGDLEGAADAHRRSVELAPDAPAPAFMLAQIRLVQERPEAAEEIMGRLLQAASDHPGTRFLAGRFEAGRGRYEAAAVHLEHAADALGDAATVLLHRAHVARALGQEEEARRLLALAEADLLRWEAEGFEAPRIRLQLHALAGEVEAAVATLRESWRSDRLAGPQFGAYWLDTDPLLAGLLGDPEFGRVLADIRADLDSMRAVLGEAEGG